MNQKPQDPGSDPGRPDPASPSVSGVAAPDPAGESLAELLGGRRAAIDATIGPLAFGIAFAATHQSVGWAALAAVIVSVIISAWRLSQGDKPRAVLIGLLGVVVAALIAVRTGHAVDFFLIRFWTNVASGVAWAVSIVIRWPLLGVIVGTLLGQGGKWRHDPVLLKAYSRASWIWVLQYVIRVVVWTPLFLADMPEALSIATAVLTWPLVAACVAVSGWALAHYIPKEHPGIRHPQPVVPRAA